MDSAVAKLKKEGVSEDRIDELKAAFELFDTDHSGYITLGKIHTLLNVTFGKQFKQDELEFMLKQFTDGEQCDFYSFAKSMNAKMDDPRYNEAFGDAFDLFDTEKKGVLTEDMLIGGMEKLGETLTNEEAKEMIKVASKKEDFVSLMTKHAAAGRSSDSKEGGGGGAATPTAGGGGAAASTPTPGGGLPKPGGLPRPPGGGLPAPPGGGLPKPPGLPTPPGGGLPKPPGLPSPPGGGLPSPPGLPKPPGAPSVPLPPPPK